MASSSDHPLCINSDTVARKDSLPLEKGLTKKELGAVEKALLWILQEENPLPAPQHELRKAELCRKLLGGVDSEDSDAPLKSSIENENGLDSKDLTLLSKLLNQIQQFNVEQKRDDLPSRGLSLVETEDFQKPQRHSKHPHVAVEKAPGLSEKMAESVVDVAGAAAEAAKAAAAAAAKNIEVMETLLDNSNNLAGQHGTTNESCKSETSKENCSEASDDTANKLVKKVQRQSRITHWMLAIMIVTTFAWRYKVITMVLDAQKTFTNPFQTIGDIIDGFKGSKKEEQKAPKSFQLPSLLREKGNEISEMVEKGPSEDPKVGEGLAISLENIFSAGKPSTDQSNGSSSGNES